MNGNKIAVIGSGSMVGSRFVELYEKKHGTSLVKADLNSNIPIDITSFNSVNNFFKKNDFNWAILFSAYTDVDNAQKQKGDRNGLCWKINVNGAKFVADAAQQFKKNLIFISTDFVFDGKNGPYKEEDKPSTNEESISWYGYTKAEGEKIINRAQVSSIILRISYPYRGKFQKKEDFAKIIIKKYKEGSLYPMFDDQTLTPTFIDDLEKAIEILLVGNHLGIFHLASPDPTTPYKFAKHLLETFKLDSKDLKKGSIEEFLKTPSATPRPVSGGLNVDKITNLGFKPTGWDEGIEEIYSQTKGELI